MRKTVVAPSYICPAAHAIANTGQRHGSSVTHLRGTSSTGPLHPVLLLENKTIGRVPPGLVSPSWGWLLGSYLYTLSSP